MEVDNVDNTITEIRNKEQRARRSKSRSVTPMIISNDKEFLEHNAMNDVSSARHASGRKLFAASKTIHKSKTYTTGKNTVVLTETKSSQEQSRTIPNDVQEVDVEVTTKNDNRPMELRSDRHRSTHVANGTGKEEAVHFATAKSTVQARSAGKSKAHRRRTFPLRTSDYSSDDEDQQEEELRDEQSQRVLRVYHGDFWNELPKTDFTYSPISKDYYKEVAPGVSIKPNMSRSSYQSYSGGSTAAYSTGPSLVTPPSSYSLSTRGLHSSKTTTSVTTSSQRSSRFFNASKAGSRVPAYINAYASPDSDEDEVETRIHAAAAASASRPPAFVTYFISFFSTIWTIITTTWTTIIETTKRMLGLQTNVARYGYSTPVRQQQSVGWWRRMTDLFYALPAMVTGADLGLLSYLSNGEQGRSKRLRLFWVLLLLLLLFLCGWLLFALLPEETVSHTSAMIGQTQAAIGNWLALFGDWLKIISSWILLPLAVRETQQKEELVSMKVDETKGVPPLAVHIPPATTSDISILIEQLLRSPQFEHFMESKLGKYNQEELVKEIVINNHFTSWIAARFNENKVDVEALTQTVLASGQFSQALEESQKPLNIKLLAEDVWNSGQLQQFIDMYLNERKHIWLFAQEEFEEKIRQREEENLELMRTSLKQELADKSKYFEIHNIKMASEMENIIDKKLNASLNDLRSKLTLTEEMKQSHEDEIRLLKMQLKKCCSKAAPAFPTEDIEKYVLRYMAGLFGISNKESVGFVEMQALMGNLFVGRQQFEAALANVTAHHKAEMKEVSEESARILMETISERISEEFAVHQKLNVVNAASTSFPHTDNSDSSSFFAASSVGLTDTQVLDIVNQAIMRYDADKTGMVDYALESSGGSIINTRCTESYYKHSASMTLFGIPYWYPSNTPRTVIQPGVHPGECWAFRGSHGFLVIQLAGLVRISSFSIEHIPRSLAFNGNIDSAPKDFSVWGLEKENDPEPMELGKYTYLKNSTSLQYFIVKRSDVQPYKIIELRIESNHGNLEYTCLYRFRVHGTWVSY